MNELLPQYRSRKSSFRHPLWSSNGQLTSLQLNKHPIFRSKCYDTTLMRSHPLLQVVWWLGDSLHAPDLWFTQRERHQLISKAFPVPWRAILIRINRCLLASNVFVRVFPSFKQNFTLHHFAIITTNTNILHSNNNNSTKITKRDVNHLKASGYLGDYEEHSDTNCTSLGRSVTACLKNSFI